MKNILIIEDEIMINNVITEYLVENGYNVVQSFDGAEGLLKYHDDIDLIIVDVMMPILDGFTFTKEIRKKANVPIIMLTALDDECDVIKGYDYGVDEYVSKPFSPKIIVKKVEAILKRQIKKQTDKVITRGCLELSPSSMTTKVNMKDVILSKKEFELLLFLIDNERNVFSRDQLLDKVWGYDYFGDDRVVDSCIKRLRKKISPANAYIKTVFGVGYKFEVTS